MAQNKYETLRHSTVLGLKLSAEHKIRWKWGWLFSQGVTVLLTCGVTVYFICLSVCHAVIITGNRVVKVVVGVVGLYKVPTHITAATPTLHATAAYATAASFSSLTRHNYLILVPFMSALKCLDNLGFESRLRQQIFSSTKFCDRLWDATSFTFIWYRRSIPDIHCPRRKTDHLPISKNKINKLELYLHSPIRLHVVYIQTLRY